MFGADPTRADQRGSVLLALLVMIVVLGLTASMAGQSLQAIMQREREEELLWRGLQYRRALAGYQNFKHGAQQMYPSSLDDLLKDPRSATRVRHLRRLYNDPMTGEEWEIIKDPAERIIGVHSSSDLEPFKQSGFPEGLEGFEGKTSYRDWQFVYVPEKQSAGRPPGQAGQPPAADNPFSTPNPR